MEKPETEASDGINGHEKQISSNGHGGVVNAPDDGSFTEIVTVAKFTDHQNGYVFAVPGLWWLPSAPDAGEKSLSVRTEAFTVCVAGGLDMTFDQFPYSTAHDMVRFADCRIGTITFGSGQKLDIVILHKPEDDDAGQGDEATELGRS